MALYPKARHRIIPPGANDPKIESRIGILHVDASDSESLFDYFNGPSGGVESHFHIPKVKQIEQYRDTDWEADANHLANPFGISVETQGLAGEPWNDKQLGEIKDLMVWLDDIGEVPLRPAQTWDDPKGGWGYHVLFGSPGPWTPHVKSCPGPLRIKQFNIILIPWMKEQNDMFTDQDRQLLKDLTVKVSSLEAKVENSNKRNYERFRKLKALVESLRGV